MSGRLSLILGIGFLIVLIVLYLFFRNSGVNIGDENSPCSKDYLSINAGIENYDPLDLCPVDGTEEIKYYTPIYKAAGVPYGEYHSPKWDDFFAKHFYYKTTINGKTYYFPPEGLRGNEGSSDLNDPQSVVAGSETFPFSGELTDLKSIIVDPALGEIKVSCNYYRKTIGTYTLP